MIIVSGDKTPFVPNICMENIGMLLEEAIRHHYAYNKEGGFYEQTSI